MAGVTGFSRDPRPRPAPPRQRSDEAERNPAIEPMTFLARRHTLRARAALAFAAVTLLLSTAMIIGVWVSVSRFVLIQREQTTLAQTSANAGQVQRGLSTPGLPVPQLLAQLPRETGSMSLLADRGRWSTTSLQVGRGELPRQLREMALDGQPSRQRITVDGRTLLAIGVPLAGLNQAYFEVFSLDELDAAYRILGIVLVVTALLVVPASLLLGWWVTLPSLRPLDRITTAAAAIAHGDLRARIDPRGDPVLTPLAASFSQTAAALEHRVRSDVRFAADVSHELRSPLTTMLSAMALVEGYRDCLPEEGQEGLALLGAEVDRFERLVADLLEISRADAGRSDLDLEDVRLADLVRETVRRQSLGHGSTYPLRVDPAATGIVVRADKRRLERVVTNLLDNAEKHGEGLAAVTVACADEHAQVIVDDAGPGVPAEERDRIFERFARGSGSSRASSEGSGLGLSLVERHVHLMGGSVSVQDSPGGGARFIVDLPCEKNEPCGA